MGINIYSYRNDSEALSAAVEMVDLLEDKIAKDREAMQAVVEKALRHDHLQGPVEDAIDNMARRLEE